MMWQSLRKWLGRFGRITFLTILLAGFVLLAAPEQPNLQTESVRVNALVGVRDFDFVTWTVEALLTKATTALVGGQHYLSPEAQATLVRDFMDKTGDIRLLNQRLSQIYALEADPEAAAVAISAEMAQKRAELDKIQPLAEAILQDQATVILKEAGFNIGGSVIPPVEMHLTPLPSILIVSPRDTINRVYQVPLQHGLTVPEQQALETALFEQLDLAALVVPIGGLAVFPAMIVETGNLNWVANTFIHEWVHHWLLAHPLGYRYYESGATQTINETVASIVGDELGPFLIERYYPDLAPPPLPIVPNPAPAPAESEPEPPAFDFREEMRITRVEVDRLLAEGEVVSAERYMEQRRQLFVENGYLIRRLNQAYFAFYGAYADQPGASGGNPIGPTVVDVRAESDSLRDFLHEVAPITTLEELEALLDSLSP